MAKQKEETNILEEIKSDLKEKKKMPKEVLYLMNGNIFRNIAMAITITIFFYFINLGFLNIKPDVFVMDLKVFSMGILVLAIILFERAYQKDSGRYCIHGIEILFLAITMLVSIYIYLLLEYKFVLIITLASYIFCIYYVLKSIIIYIKSRKAYKKEQSDIKEIVKKEKPKKKEATKKLKKQETMDEQKKKEAKNKVNIQGENKKDKEKRISQKTNSKKKEVKEQLPNKEIKKEVEQKSEKRGRGRPRKNPEN